MKGKIIAILVMTLLIATTLPAVGKTTNSNGLKDTGQETTPNFSTLLKPTSSLRGYNIAVINAGYYPADVKSQLELWGATVALINIPDITVALLSGYDAVWIPVGASMDIDDRFKDDEIRDYVFQGGELIFCQPNDDSGVYIPKCLPYTWEITDYLYVDPCAATIVDPTHPLTKGLTLNDMPDCYETIGFIAPEYTILALSASGEPGFACAKFGTGKIIVSMDAILPFDDVCGDDPALSEDMVMRMFDWADKAKSVELPINIAINRPLLQFLQNHPNLFPLLQKLFHNFGL
jgi:hypothetical protein